MKLVGVKINNYKSFGEDENFLYVNNLNTVIGKNESGKSNLLEVLSDIEYIGTLNDNLFENNNRKSDKDVSVELMFKTKENEKFIYGEYQGTVSVKLEKKDTYKINSEFGKYIVTLDEYQKILNKILLLKDEVPINKLENINKMEEIINRFKNASNEIFVEPEFYYDWISMLKKTRDEKILELVNSFDKMIRILENIYINFPSFIKIENKDLKNKYTINELKDELQDYNNESILYQFFYICGIDYKKFD